MHSNRNTTSIFCLTLVLFSILCGAQNPSHFKADLDFGGGTVISTFLDVHTKGDDFTITSPKDADVRIMGSKAKLGRAMGKSPKKGIIVTITGVRKADSLLGTSKMPMFGKLSFKGQVKDGKLDGKLSREDGTEIGTLSGIASTEDRISYQELYPKMMQTVRENIYSPDVLKTDDWKAFEAKIQKLCSDAHDDIELFFGFNMLAQTLPFTHLSLTIARELPDEEETDTKPNDPTVTLETKNGDTAYLKVKNFSSSAQELEQTLPKIVSNPAYHNLIIDLRDNGGGGVSAAFALAKYIVREDIEVGYFPTNKLQYSGFQPQAFKNLPELQPINTNAFGDELKTTPGVKMVFKKPTNPVFQGNLYVLTNGRTASTCEPIVYALKHSKSAVIVGENTYGGMLAASPFKLSDKYLLLVPIGDFYTHDGVRLDKLGVAPDVEVKSDEALDAALKYIESRKG